MARRAAAATSGGKCSGAANSPNERSSASTRAITWRLAPRDPAPHRRDVLFDGRPAHPLRRTDLLGHELQVQDHVVQRVLALVRQADGNALREARAIRIGAIVSVLSGCS